MSYKFLSKNGPTIAFLATVVVLVITLIPILSGLDKFNSVPEAQQSYSNEGNMFNTGIYLTAILLVIGVVAILLFSIFEVVKNPKGSLKSLIALGVLAIIFVILFSIADADAAGSLGENIARFNIPASISKIISAGISLTMVLGAGAVILAIALEVWNYFKN